MSAAMCLSAQWLAHSHLVVVVPAEPPDGDVSPSPQVGEYVGSRALCEAERLRDGRDGIVGMLGNVEQDRGVIRQERPALASGRFCLSS